METYNQNFFNKEVFDTLLEKAKSPTIISVSRNNSFGAHWLKRLLDSVKNKYQGEISIYTFYLEDPDKIMSLLGEGRSMITYFIKEKKINARLTGSVSKNKFYEKLSNIL